MNKQDLGVSTPKAFYISAFSLRSPVKASARSAQLVSPPPTVLRASEIQQEGCFRASAQRVPGFASHTLPFA
ncbi:hypothetical protein QUB68_13005 [Microcoleus sp. A006_D1]|uniref:hypothetical protein n=1 Tax=Microcoleus sp. A006_D1 TaxID=3055267 RepID=UPI002FD66EFE